MTKKNVKTSKDNNKDVNIKEKSSTKKENQTPPINPVSAKTSILPNCIVQLTTQDSIQRLVNKFKAIEKYQVNNSPSEINNDNLINILRLKFLPSVSFIKTARDKLRVTYKDVLANSQREEKSILTPEVVRLRKINEDELYSILQLENENKGAVFKGVNLKRDTSNFPDALITSELDYSPNKVVVIKSAYTRASICGEIDHIIVLSIHGDVLLSEYLETKCKHTEETDVTDKNRISLSKLHDMLRMIIGNNTIIIGMGTVKFYSHFKISSNNIFEFNHYINKEYLDNSNEAISDLVKLYLDEDIFKEENGKEKDSSNVIDDCLLHAIATAALVWFYFNDEGTSGMIANNYFFYKNYYEIRDNRNLEKIINFFDVDIDSDNSIMKTGSGVYGICAFIGRDSDYAFNMLNNYLDDGYNVLLVDLLGSKMRMFMVTTSKENLIEFESDIKAA